jgi:hypothetical protein
MQTSTICCGRRARVDKVDARGADRTSAGLCADCLHARRVESSRGSIFVLCLRAERDPAFKKYPALPVKSCVGYEPRT